MGKVSKFNIQKSKAIEETPVAIYVRMSTDHQKYSIANQIDAILKYAKRRQMKVVKTYTDKGKSGLDLKGREGLSNLLRDVELDEANYKAILVYDVSRWGRFQDADESAYYEYTCKKAGIKVHYCAEQFENDDSSFSTIVKNLKRAMAGEYSRELSVKIFNGQCRIVRKGFKAGAPAGYGMRRLLIDKDGNPKQVLNDGEAKCIRTDRVTLIPGPKDEVDNIKLIFNLFVNCRMSSHEIAKVLIDKEKQKGSSKRWTHSTILNILKNEKFIGNNVYNRISRKLKSPSIMNPPEEWVRSNNVFKPIISKKLFRKAQKLIKLQRRSMSDEDMLKGLEKLYKKCGYLSSPLIDNAPDIPSANAYTIRFKSLYTAYAIVGFHHDQKGRSDEELLIKLKNLYQKHGYITYGLMEKTEGMPARNTYLKRFGSLEKAYELVGYVKGNFHIPPEIMLKKLGTLYKKKGYLTEDLVNKSKITPRASTYRKAFGSLITAYHLVGFDPESLKIKNEELIEHLKILLIENGYLDGPMIDASDLPYTRAIYSNRFGNLPNAYALAGYKFEKYGMSKEIMLLKVKKLFEEKGRLTIAIIDECEDIPCSHTYVNRFGSIRKLYELIGYNYRQSKYTKDELLKKLQILYAQKGWLSKKIIMETKGMPSPSTYIYYFGSLRNVYRIIGFKPEYIPSTDKI